MSNYGKSPCSAANPAAVVQGEQFRITVLTDRMARLEYSPDGTFVDQQTQIVLSRNFPVPEYHVDDKGSTIDVVTDYLIISYEKNQPFANNTLSIQMVGNPYLKKSGTWFYGSSSLEDLGNLKGTATTLDNAVGDQYYRDSADEAKVWGEPDSPVVFDEGLMSKNGFSVIDDSASLIFDEDGWVHPAPEGHKDIYFLNYGRNYLDVLKVFYQMTGSTPMLPRYALGNWWSRFYKYTQESYLDLLKRFREERIPIAVGVLDMDWHYVDIDPKYGKGWTGYTWNKEWFPDPAAMIKEIHDNGMHFSLNVHPADGVKGHEEMYIEMAKELGVDYEHEIPISFDITSRKFLDAYFKYLHHPNEEIGVDFWWIDWQQGSDSKIPGYDPLWMLNHYHYQDNGRKGMRPMNFSRYAGLGSHRYPIGFSGSTFITWESLDFQPYFTANASNVGYGWWSHDIGGHRNGYREDELTTRWVQFGVFSPIMRLHSSDEVFTGKEPWKFCADSERVMRRFLNLRHELIPYTYTMNRRFFTEGRPLIEPMYYRDPDDENAYKYRNEYYFGSSLIVSPITSKSNPETRTGSVKTWLPSGDWIDFFSGVHYKGNRTITMHRDIDTIPVLAKTGSIIPMDSPEELSSQTDNPKHLVLHIFCGADGFFDLYEDDGISMNFENGDYATTAYTLDWANRKFTAAPAQGNLSLIPEVRDYTLKFFGVGENALEGLKLSCSLDDAQICGETQVRDAVQACGDADPDNAQTSSDADPGEVAAAPTAPQMTYDADRHILTVEIWHVKSTEGFTCTLSPDVKVPKNNLAALAYTAINRAQIPFASKENTYRILNSSMDVGGKLSTIETIYMSEDMKSVLRELLLADA